MATGIPEVTGPLKWYIAKELKAARLRKKMSQLQVALKAGITQGQYCLAERRGHLIRIDTLFLIAEALEVSPSILLPETLTELKEEYAAQFGDTKTSPGRDEQVDGVGLRAGARSPK